MDSDKAARRHARIWRLLAYPARAVTFLKLGFVPAPSELRGPFLLVSNHNTDWDPVLISGSFCRQPMYFVSSEHVLRSPFWGRLLSWAQDPIPRQKGGSAAGTVRAVLRRLKEGSSVALFPEGNRSWDGVTGPFPPAIGKLAKMTGVPLVTYRLAGGYFASPRWSGASTRRGRMTGRVVRVYSPSDLAAMTPGEVNGHIRSDIYENAYEDARSAPVRYYGKKLAEHLETLLFLCPSCGKLHTLRSEGDTVRCTRCGFHFAYLPTGFLAGEALPADNLRDWNLWQQGEICRMCDSAGEDLIFSDTRVFTDEIVSAQSEKRLGEGAMRLYAHRLELPGVTVPLEEITGMALTGAQSLFVGAGGRSYEIRSRHIRCLVKYLTAVRHLTGKDLSV